MSYTVALVGSALTGKTAYMEKLFAGNYNRNYIETTVDTNRQVAFNTTRGRIVLNILDVANSTNFNYATGGIILFMDTSLQQSINAANTFVARHPNNLITACHSMCDCIPAREDVPVYKNYDGVPISTRTGHNLYEPIVRIIRLMTGDPLLMLVELPANRPPAVAVVPQPEPPAGIFQIRVADLSYAMTSTPKEVEFDFTNCLVTFKF